MPPRLLPNQEELEYFKKVEKCLLYRLGWTYGTEVSKGIGITVACMFMMEREMVYVCLQKEYHPVACARRVEALWDVRIGEGFKLPASLFLEVKKERVEPPKQRMERNPLFEPPSQRMERNPLLGVLKPWWRDRNFFGREEFEQYMIVEQQSNQVLQAEELLDLGGKLSAEIKRRKGV